MKVLLFAPNAGLSFSTGGGSGFGLKLAEVLLSEGHHVTLAGYHSLSLPALDAIHGTRVSAYSDRVSLARTTRYDRAFPLYRGLPFKLSAYTGLLAPSFGRWVRRTLESSRADIIVFQDDVPICALPAIKDKTTYVYVHYPFLGLRTDLIPPLRSVLTSIEWTNDRLLTLLSSRFILANPAEFADAVWTNSTITARVVASVWPASEPRYVPTYLDPPSSPVEPKPKPQTILSLGSFQPAKNYPFLLDAFSQVRKTHPMSRMVIAGHARDSSHVRHLRRKISRLGLGDSVHLVQDISREDLRALLDTASVLVHPALFEPFGLALLEGMAHGCAGVATRSEYAGGWVDILERGRFGLGFATKEELAQVLDNLLSSPAYVREMAGKASERVATFSRERLRASVTPYFR
jgi:glycosyltransferase involved in cell wall biosynthesis